MLDMISKSLAEYNANPTPLLTLIILFVLIGIGSKLNKIVDHLSQISYHSRYIHEAIDKTVSELESIETHLGYIDDNISAVKNDFYPSQNLEAL